MAAYEERTDVATPDGGVYVIREAYDCKPVGGCELDRSTRRKRLEYSTGRVVHDPLPAESPTIPIGWVVSPSLYLTVHKVPSVGERVVAVRLPDGAATVTDYQAWALMDSWPYTGIRAYLYAPLIDLATPIPVAVLTADGEIVPVAGGDWRHYRPTQEAGSACARDLLATAAPVEALLAHLPGRPYSSLQRHQLFDGRIVAADMAPTGDTDARCMRAQAQFLVAQRRDEAVYMLLGLDGAPLTPQTYASTDAAFADIAPALAAAAQARAATPEEQARAAARAAAVAAAQRQQSHEEMQALQAAADVRTRAEVTALLAAGHTGQAMHVARTLPAEEYAAIALQWREAPLDVYESALKALEDAGVSRIASPTFRPLEARVNDLRACAGHLQAPGLPASAAKWLNMAPYDRARHIAIGPPGGALYSGQAWAFDATRFEWVIIDTPNRDAPPDYRSRFIINDPSIPVADPQAATREARHARCVREARARSNRNLCTRTLHREGADDKPASACKCRTRSRLEAVAEVPIFEATPALLRVDVDMEGGARWDLQAVATFDRP